MKSRTAKWENERRWTYAHAVLSMDIALPFYPYLGIPFQAAQANSFVDLLRAYDRWAYLDPNSPPVPLATRQDHLLGSLQAAFGLELTNVYVRWLLDVFEYTPGDETPGLSEWYSIFMRCAVRENWWSKLALPYALESAVFRDLDDTRARLEDAREMADTLAAQARTSWDQWMMATQGIAEGAVAMGEPFTRLTLTATQFLFTDFWVRLLVNLSSRDLDDLWIRGQAVARELKISPEAVLHPSTINVELARWWAASQGR